MKIRYHTNYYMFGPITGTGWKFGPITGTVPPPDLRVSQGDGDFDSYKLQVPFGH